MSLCFVTPLAVAAARYMETKALLGAELGRLATDDEVRARLGWRPAADYPRVASGEWSAPQPPAATIAPADHARIDALEAAMLAPGARVVDLPLVHRWTPGLYIREIFMPAGTLLTSKIHNTEHPYVVTKGRVSVYIPGAGVQVLEAGHFGITKPGTRRVLYIHEDTTWITFHPNPDDEPDLEKIEARLIERRELADGTTANDAYAALLAELPDGFLPKETTP